MALLEMPTLQNATGEVKEIFEEINTMLGSVPNGIATWGVSPKALKIQWDSIKQVLNYDEDTQKMHTIIRYLIAEKDGCKYCIGFNAGMLINIFGISQEQLERIKTDPSLAPLNDKNKASLLIALKAVKNGYDVTKEDIDLLKSFGMSEEEIFDLIRITASMLVIDVLFKTFKVDIDY